MKRITVMLAVAFDLHQGAKNLKRFLVVQNFSKALRIRFISFNLSGTDKGCLRFERFRLALFKNRHYRIQCENECRGLYRVIEAADWLSAK